MKKVLAILLSLIMLVSLTACGSESDKFLKDYEAWVDDYIELAADIKENPLDSDLLAKSMEMLGEAAEWMTRAEDIEKELKDSPEKLEEFENEIERISEKMANAGK